MTEFPAAGGAGSPPDPRARFLTALGAAIRDGSFVKLTLGKRAAGDPSLRNLFVRPVALKDGPRLNFLWRRETSDTAKNHAQAEALALLDGLIGREFLDAHLFTSAAVLRLTSDPAGRVRLGTQARPPTAAAAAHDRAKTRAIAADASWLRALGVTNERGRPREGMSAKFRQIQKFAELLSQLIEEAGLRVRDAQAPPLRVADMGSGKGYLTFAVGALLGAGAEVLGVEARPQLAEFCNKVAREEGFAPGLSFSAGAIGELPLRAVDILIALHACDTATDDALARGIAAGASLIVVAPCCQKELRPRLAAPPVLARALRHGIWLERHAEFVTDALRAQLLEWAGYRTKVFEFVSTEHTAKNTMIAAVRARPPGDEAVAGGIREFARFYGVSRQSLADQLGFEL